MSTKTVRESQHSRLADAADELVASTEPSFDAETFFGEFALLAETPGALKELRKVIFTLAIRGRLVIQNSNDEGVLALLDQIATHKTALAKSGSLRGSTSVTPIDIEETEYTIPESWIWVRFGDIMVNRDGERIPVSKVDRANKTKTYDYYGASGVIDKIDQYLFDKPLLLIGEDGANLINRSTPIAYIARGKYWVNNHAHVLDGISEDFLRFIELHINAISLERYITGSAQPKMNQAKMNAIPIALPPLAEQKRIVAKVDELMALCDRLEALDSERQTSRAALSRAALARFADSPTQSNLQYLFHKSFDVEPDELRTAILSLAVRGKLTNQDSDDEPSQRIVERIASIKLALSLRNAAKDSARLRDLPESETDFEIPTLWKWCRLGQLISEFRYGTSRKCDRTAGQVPVLRIPNIQSGRIDPTDLKFTDMPASEFDELRLRAGDLLLVRSNGSESLVGRSAVAFEADESFAYAGYLVRARPPLDQIYTPYIHIALSTPSVRDQIERPIRTTSGVKNLNTTEISNLAIPLPPLSEQKRIVAKVDELMELVDELERQLVESRSKGQQLMQAVVARLTAVTTDSMS